MNDRRSLKTRKGDITFPAYIPVTTFGQKYPLDDLIRPYLPRLAPAVMVSYYYAQQQTCALRFPILIDSGGFVSLFEKARVIARNGLGLIEVITETGVETIDPITLLEFQEAAADVAFTLDFPIPPGMDEKEGRHRLELTIANAMFALHNRRRRDLPLYACVQGWNHQSYVDCARSYTDKGFDGLAIGGLVPRSQDRNFILGVIEAIRNDNPSLPIHAFGIGQPQLVRMLFERGVDSVDSSSYVKMAADGRLWGGQEVVPTTPLARLHIALCNLAMATNRSLPLGFTDIAFSTTSLARQSNVIR